MKIICIKECYTFHNNIISHPYGGPKIHEETKIEVGSIFDLDRPNNSYPKPRISIYNFSALPDLKGKKIVNLGISNPDYPYLYDSYFVELSEWREKQINEILHEDSLC